MAEKVQVDVELTGAAKTVGGLEDVADAAAHVEDHDAVTVTADAEVGDARRGLDDVATAVDDLDGTDATITARLTNQTSGPLADIFGDLDKLSTRAKEAGDKLDAVGSPDRGKFSAKGQAISDLTGPLGDVSGTASDVAGVFDGLGDTLEGLGAKMGVSTEAIMGSLGAIGFGVTAAITAWSYFRQKQDEAQAALKKTADEQRKLADLLREAKYGEAAQSLVDTYGKVYDAAHKAGIGVEEVTNFLAGYTDDLPTATAHIQDIAKAQHDHGETTATLIAAYSQLIDPVLSARDGIDKANDSIKTQDDRTKDATEALQAHATSAGVAADAQQRLKDKTERLGTAFDTLSGKVDLDAEFHQFEASMDTAMTNTQNGIAITVADVDGYKRDLVDLARTAGANPVDVQSTLKKLDAGDYAAVKSDAERYYQNNPVAVAARLQLARNIAVPPGVIGASLGATAAPVVNVTQYLPRGWRGDALGDARRQARRAGGLYQRFSR